MSDRKYRQRGYQDDERDRTPQGPRQPPRERQPGAPRRQPGAYEHRTPNMPGFREVLRCARCGSVEDSDIGSLSRCSRCGTDLHACVQCVHFDTAARFECTQAIAARISPKDARNDCTLFQARTTVERQTTSSAEPSSARKAFDDLFKF